MIRTWNLNFWNTGEWQVIEEHLNDLRRSRVVVNPERSKRFLALDEQEIDSVKVVIFGQDPYPDHRLCTGRAFSVPADVLRLPPTLNVIFDEYESDLHYPRPANGDLSHWSRQGVLLWNVVPTCTEGHSLSHDWPEWELLNKEIIDVLVDKPVVFVFFGSIARRYARFVPPWCHVIETAHPSPRANISAKTPFKGSRVFTKINDCLADLKQETIDWRLP